MYLPAEWGPRTQETTLLRDSAMTTRHAGLSCVQKGSSVDQDERLQLEARISRVLTDLLPCKTSRAYLPCTPTAPSLYKGDVGRPIGTLSLSLSLLLLLLAAFHKP